MSHTASLASYGAYALQRQDFNSAVVALRIATSEKPDDVTLAKAYAMALVGINRPGEGLKELQRVAPLAANDLELHCNAGEIASQMGQWNTALDHLERCLRIDPDAKHGSGVRARMLIRKIQKQVEQSVS